MLNAAHNRVCICLALLLVFPASDGLAGDAGSDLTTAHPGVHVLRSGSAQTVFYGTVMTTAATPAEAADTWLSLYSDEFGIAGIELSLAVVREIGFGKFTLFEYSQSVGGIPVEFGAVRVLVLNADFSQVVHVASRLAATPADDALRGDFPASDAVSNVRELREYRGLREWTLPEPVIVITGDGVGVEAWKFVGREPTLSIYEAYTFFVDTRSGKLIEARNEVFTIDITGTVEGYATPGVLPDTGTNPPLRTALSEIRVVKDGGGGTRADRNGQYVLSNDGTADETLSTNLARGRWVEVNNVAGALLSSSQTVTPPGPADFIFNESPTELTTAQVNAFVQTNNIHNYIADRSDGSLVNFKMIANVNLDANCNAFYNGQINFFTSGGRCVNTAYSSIITHEYGHFIVARRGLEQGAFGEGYSDTASIMLYDSPFIGRNVCGTGCHFRNPATADQQYPCASTRIHTCGQILGGAWFDIKQAFKSVYGDTAGLDLAQQLHVDWTLMTGGGDGLNSAHPATVIEVLTVDDDDGDLDNGTPNWIDICQAFENHGIPCPVQSLHFELPDGLPRSIRPHAPFEVRVNVRTAAGNAFPATGTVSYRIGTSGSFVTVSMPETAPSEYVATLPAADCAQTVQYYFSAESSDGVFTSPPGAPEQLFEVGARFADIVVFTDDFEIDNGWATSGGADSGHWTRTTPRVCLDQAGSPAADYDGSGACYVTGNSPGPLCTQDVDTGSTRLLSPSFDLSGAQGAAISYWRWVDSPSDPFTAQLRADGGAWIDAEVVRGGGLDASGGQWLYHEIQVHDFVPLTSNVQVRFKAEDRGADNTVEAAIDAITVSLFDCTPPACLGDLNGDGLVDINDLAALLGNFGTVTGATAADGDLDGDADVDLSDLVILLSEFDTVCP